MKYLVFFVIILTSINCYAEILGDINDDNQVNPVEAIHALQVSAGIKNKLTITDNSLDAADGNPKDALYIDNDGRVGIGTTTPTANLTLKPGNKYQFNKQLTGLVTVAPNSTKVNGDNNTLFTQELKAGATVLIANEFISISKIINDRTLDLSNDHISGAFNEAMFTSSDIIAIHDSNNNPALVINQSGDVGIGVLNPSAKLDINGSLISKVYRNSSFSEKTFYNDSTTPAQIPDKTLIFDKLKNETSIKIEYSDYIGGYHNGCLSAYLEIRINGKSCPGGKLLYLNYTCDNDTVSRTHTYQTFKGFCDGLSTGTYEIQLWIHKEANNYKCFYVGYETSRWTIEAEEVY